MGPPLAPSIRTRPRKRMSPFSTADLRLTPPGVLRVPPIRTGQSPSQRKRMSPFSTADLGLMPPGVPRAPPIRTGQSQSPRNRMSPFSTADLGLTPPGAPQKVSHTMPATLPPSPWTHPPTFRTGTPWTMNIDVIAILCRSFCTFIKELQILGERTTRYGVIKLPLETPLDFVTCPVSFGSTSNIRT